MRKSEFILVGTFAPERSEGERSYEDKITFTHAYRTQFFHTACAKLDLAHAVLLERAQSNTLRTECEKKNLAIVYSNAEARTSCSIIFK